MAAANASYPGALPPPSGQTANLNAPTPKVQAAWIAANAIILGVPTLLSPARVYVRAWIMRKWTFSDVSFFIAWALHVAECSVGFAEVDYGVGQPGWNLAPATFEKFSEYLNIQQIIYQPAMAFTKNCILLQLIEIFVPRRKGIRYNALLAIVVFNFIFFTVMLFLEIFECSPRSKIWNADVPGKCLDIEETFIVTAAINVSEDFAILGLPIYWTWQLNLVKSKKFKVAAIFTVGAFACVCSIMRLVETVINVAKPDISVALVPVSLWSMAEVGAGLVIACMPFIPKAFKEIPFYKNNRMRKLVGMRTWYATRSQSASAPLEKFSSESLHSASRIQSGSSTTTNQTRESGATFMSAGVEQGDPQFTGILRTFQVRQYSSPRVDLDSH